MRFVEPIVRFFTVRYPENYYQRVTVISFCYEAPLLAKQVS